MYKTQQLIRPLYSWKTGIEKAIGSWAVFWDDEHAPEHLHHLEDYIDNNIKERTFIWLAVKDCRPDTGGNTQGSNIINCYITPLLIKLFMSAAL